jgi:hypothetical protein
VSTGIPEDGLSEDAYGLEVHPCAVCLGKMRLRPGLEFFSSGKLVLLKLLELLLLLLLVALLEGAVAHYRAHLHYSMRQPTSAYVSLRQHTSAYVNIRHHTSIYVSKRPSDGLE